MAEEILINAGPILTRVARVFDGELVDLAVEPTGRRGAVVKAFVVPAHGVAGDDALAAELQDHVKRLAPPYMYPRAVAFETELPKTINGKIRRSELRRRANDPGA